MALLRFSQSPLFQRATWKRALSTFHANDTGADEGMNKLLIFALVALPLLALLIFFGGEIVKFANTQFDTVFGSAGAGAVSTGR